MAKNTIPAPRDGYSAADILRLAREHDVPGILVRRGRRFETRSYAVAGSVPAVIRALPTEHYTR